MRLSGMIPFHVLLWVLLPALAFSQVQRNITDTPALLAHYERNDHHNSVIIFVHGLFGNASASWSCEHSKSWPEMLLSDEAFADSDVYVASYDTPAYGGSMSLDEVVSELKNRLDADAVFSKHHSIIFVAHSLGGLVVQKLLVTYPSLIPSTKLIYFFSTPETGSGVANYARLFNSDPLIKELRSGNGNDYLQSLEDSWRATQDKHPITTKCAYETKKLHHVLVVDRLSATRMCPIGVPLPIYKDHLTIVKPCSVNDDAYRALKNAIEEVRKKAITPDTSAAHTFKNVAQNIKGGTGIRATGDVAAEFDGVTQNIQPGPNGEPSTGISLSSDRPVEVNHATIAGDGLGFQISSPGVCDNGAPSRFEKPPAQLEDFALHAHMMNFLEILDNLRASCDEAHRATLYRSQELPVLSSIYEAVKARTSVTGDFNCLEMTAPSSCTLWLATEQLGCLARFVPSRDGADKKLPKCEGPPKSP